MGKRQGFTGATQDRKGETMGETPPTKTEGILFRALCRVRELPEEYRDAVLDRGMEEWLESFLTKHPICRRDMEEGEAFTRFFSGDFSMDGSGY